MFKLLSRDAFRDRVFARDGHRCVVCGASGALDAHHVVERRLWPDGGYYLENGVSVCEAHHLACERTTLSCEGVRARAGIQATWIPPHLRPDLAYDKWGNPVLPDSTRLRGELFFEPNVQKALAEGGVLGRFLPRALHPRACHLPGSAGSPPLPSLDGLLGQEVVVSPRLPGKRVSLYRDIPVQAGGDPSAEVTALHAHIAAEIPENWRVCGVVSPDAFHVTTVWTDRDVCLSWDETVEWAALLDLAPAPVLTRGTFDVNTLPTLGFPCVVRVAARLSASGWRTAVGVFVPP